MSTYRERRLQKAEKLRGWAEKREQRASHGFASAMSAIAGIELGQPILVGHHSERRHRAALERHDSRMRAAFESQNLAQSMTSRADNIEHAADRAIYSDDRDAVEQLTEKIATLEAQRERIKAVNTMIRKRGLQACMPDLTEDEKRELLSLIRLCPYHHCETRGFPPYMLQNLGGNISRERKRLAMLSGTRTAPLAPIVGDTATARAGLVIEQTMTTPSRPGKQPREVWNVRGNLAFWRPMLSDLGGSWYREVFSFWEDPTTDIEQACAEAESHTVEVSA